MNIKNVSISEIRPYERNPRRNDQAVEFVANSIREFGWKQPIVVDKDGVIVAGHTRFKAAKKLGLRTVPVVVADDLTEEQIKAYRLADNKTGEAAEWDLPALAVELDGILELDMEQFGFADISGEDENDAEAEEEMTNPTDVLPESRVFVFGVSAFGVKTEVFLEVPLETVDAERLIERINTAGADAISSAIVEALNAC